MFQGRSVEQKRALVQAITAAMVEHAAVKPDNLIVVIDETTPENWARAGVLELDRSKR